ncbi:MAG: sulfatase [Rhodobacteraceae bacterium]|nr:sulfatase [Paracoccaceae bacterium]
MRILYIDVDSLRPDHLTPYGYQRKLCPNIQALADRAVVLGQCHSTDTPCVPSRAAFTTQRFGIETGAFGHQGRDGDIRLTESRSQRPDAPFLGYYLANEIGMHTVGMSCFAERHQSWWYHSNFMEFIRPSLSLGLDEDAADVTDTAISWLRRRGKDDNWFLALNYWDTHTEYFIDKEWIDKARATGPAPAWPDAAAIARHQEVYGAHSAIDLHGAYGAASPLPEIMPDRIANRADFEKLIDAYDGTIAYLDHHLGRLFAEIRAMGLEGEVAVILTADHGEAFGEQGVYAEHALAHPATTRVPMIIYWPGKTDALPPDARYHPGLQYHIDLGPTLCDLLGIATPAGWHGASFADVVSGRPGAGRDHLVLSQGVHSFQRAVRKGDMIYQRTFHPGTYRVNMEELFDLAADPNMEHDLMPTQPERAGPLKALLSDWWHAHAGKPGAAPDPMQSAIARGPVIYSDPERYLARLEATGRHALAKDYRARLGAALVDRHAEPAHEKPKKVFGNG